MSVFGMPLAVALFRLFFGKRLPAWPRQVYTKSMGSLGFFDFLSSHHGKPDKIPPQNYFLLGKTLFWGAKMWVSGRVVVFGIRHFFQHGVWKIVELRRSQGFQQSKHTPQCQLKAGVTPKKARWWFKTFFYFHPYLGKISNLTNFFQTGWNHQQEGFGVFFPKGVLLAPCAWIKYGHGIGIFL